MILTTTPSVEGKRIVEYLGVVTGETIMGANVVRDILASITDFIGGRSGAYESKLAEGRQLALNEMAERARQLGADAVVGIDLDFETMRDGMMIVVATVQPSNWPIDGSGIGRESHGVRTTEKAVCQRETPSGLSGRGFCLAGLARIGLPGSG